MKITKIAALIIFLLIAGIVFVPLKGNSDNKSKCIECHTSAKQLINITREIAKTRPPTKSEEQKGEG